MTDLTVQTNPATLKDKTSSPRQHFFFGHKMIHLTFRLLPVGRSTCESAVSVHDEYAFIAKMLSKTCILELSQSYKSTFLD